jgi:hypothetical protein
MSFRPQGHGCGQPLRHFWRARHKDRRCRGRFCWQPHDPGKSVRRRRVNAYFLGADDPYKALKTTLKAEIDQEAWDTLHSDVSRPFSQPASGRIAVKVINHLGDEVMKVFGVG